MMFDISPDPGMVLVLLVQALIAIMLGFGVRRMRQETTLDPTVVMMYGALLVIWVMILWQAYDIFMV